MQKVLTITAVIIFGASTAFSGWVLAKDLRQGERDIVPRDGIARTEEPVRAKIRVDGRLVTYPDADVVLSTEVGGSLEKVRVHERQHVVAGEIIAELSCKEQRTALREAQARVREAEAALRLAQSEAARELRLVSGDASTQQAVEQATSNRDVAAARLETARAIADRLRVTLSKATIRAPMDAVILTQLAHTGEVVGAGAPLVRLADLSKKRVEAEVDEFDAGRIALGQTVRISAEGMDGFSWRGVVEEIPDSVGNRRIRPEDPARPTDTRVLNVKIKLLEPTVMKLGQRLEVEFGELPQDDAAATSQRDPPAALRRW